MLAAAVAVAVAVAVAITIVLRQVLRQRERVMFRRSEGQYNGRVVCPERPQKIRTTATARSCAESPAASSMTNPVLNLVLLRRTAYQLQ